MKLLIYLGILLCPIFTLACLLYYFDYPLLALLALIVSLLKYDNKD